VSVAGSLTEEEKVEAAMVQHLEGTDRRSFALGMINAFSEIVAAGGKPMALSPPIDEELFDAVRAGSDAIAADWGVVSYVERELLQTDLFPAEATEGITVILYVDTQKTLDEYLELKRERRELEAKGQYQGTARRAIAMHFGRLLGYSEEAVAKRLG